MLSLSKSFCSPWGFIAKWKCSLCLWHDFRFVNFVNQRNIEFIFQNTWNLLVDFGVHRAIALTQHSFAFKLPDDPCTHFLVYSLFCQRALSWKTQCEHGFQTVLRVIIHFCYKSSWWDGLWTFCSFALSFYRCYGENGMQIDSCCTNKALLLKTEQLHLQSLCKSAFIIWHCLLSFPSPQSQENNN